MTKTYARFRGECGDVWIDVDSIVFVEWDPSYSTWDDTADTSCSLTDGFVNGIFKVTVASGPSVLLLDNPIDFGDTAEKRWSAARAERAAA